MEQHPIPQDVTGFQFKLVGAMTVKQFGYVASGVVMAVVLYYLPIHSAIGVLLKVLLIPIFGASGAIIAFVPIDGRPIDVMTSNFIKALFSPNQYIYYRQGRKLSFTSLSISKVPTVQKTQQSTQLHKPSGADQLDQKEEKLRALLLGSRMKTKTVADKKEAAFLKALTSPMINTTSQQAELTPPKIVPSIVTKFSPVLTSPTPMHASALVSQSPQTQPPQIPITPPQMQGESEEDALTKKETELTRELSQAKAEETSGKTPALQTAAQQKIASLSKQIEEIHAQKKQLEEELSHLQKQLSTQKGQKAQPAPSPVKPVQDPLHVRTVPQAVSKKVGLPHVSDSPNVVVGIVKDPRGNILPNILVEVKDKNGNPVRAFKTNQLGQFASATPLSPGTYTLVLEDPKNQQRFDIIQIVANNQILLPIEVISHDAREELRKQLFAN